MALMLLLAVVLAGCSLPGDDDNQTAGDGLIAEQNDGATPGEVAQAPAGGGGEAAEGAQATFDPDDGSGTGISASGKSGSAGGGQGDEGSESNGGESDGSESNGGGDSDGNGDDSRPVPDTDFCEAATRVSHEIRFAPGATSRTVEETAEPGQVDRFRIESGPNQIMTVTVASPDPAIRATLMQPDGLVFPDDFVEKRINSTQGGDYFICVNPGQAVIGYTLRVSIIDNDTPPEFRDSGWCGEVVRDQGEIRFARGASSGSVDNSVIRGQRDLYRLDASAGQTMDVLLTSLEDNAVLAIRSPGGEVLTREVADVGITLPESGTYQFCVGGTRGNATYTLTVAIN